MGNSRKFKGLPLILLFAGVSLLGGALYTGSHSTLLLMNGVRTEGTVIRVEERRSSCGSSGRKHSCTKYSPVVGFTDREGVSREVKSNISSTGRSSFQVGDLHQVIYPAGDPEKAEVNSFFSLWGAPLMFTLFGVILGGLGALTLRQERLRRRLRESGRRLSAKVTSIDTVTRSRRKNSSRRISTRVTRTSYVVVAQWQDPATGRYAVFRSDPLAHSPDHLVGKEVTVFVDHANTSLYVFDEGSLGV